MTITEAREIIRFCQGRKIPCKHLDCISAFSFLEGHKAALESEATKDLTAYARHSDFCSIGPGDCDCGYKSAVLRFEEFKEETQK